MSTATAATTNGKRGRPRDPELGDRVTDVVLRLYAEHGWSAFSFGSVAREASVGKAALYLRWANKEEMLLSALAARPPVLRPVDTGSLRDDLVELTGEVLAYLNAPAGLAALRLFVDARYVPELLNASKKVHESTKVIARDIVSRAKARGDLPPAASPTLILDAIVGGATNHLLSNPVMRWSRNTRNVRFLNELVDFVLRGAEASII